MRAYDWIAKWRTKREIIRSENKERHRLEKLEQKKLERKKHVDELSDDYVKELLKAQFKSDIDALPKEILDVKRVIVLIKREQKRLKKAVKHCQKHGKLSLSQVNKSRINKSGNYNYKCKICQRELHAQNYERKKNDVLARQREYKQKNPEKVKRMKAESWQKNKHKWKKKDREKENLRRQLETLQLHDSHIKRLIRKRKKNIGVITTEMIDEKRKQVMIKRQRDKINVHDKIIEINLQLEK